MCIYVHVCTYIRSTAGFGSRTKLFAFGANAYGQLGLGLRRHLICKHL